MIHDRNAMQQAWLTELDPHYIPSHPAALAAKAAREVERGSRARSAAAAAGGSSALGWVVIAIVLIALCGGG